MSNAAFFIAAQSGVSPVAYGEPGTSKTRTIEAFAKAVGRTLEVIVGSEREPADLLGYPCLVEHEGRKLLEFVKTTWYNTLTTAAGGGLLFLDEISNSTPATQAAFLRTLGDGVPNTWIVAAANPVEQATTGFDLSPATVNRLCILEWENPINSWREGLQLGFDKLVHSFPILPKLWEEGLYHTNGLIASFTHAKTELAQRYPKSRSEACKPWPSLRSWTNASRVYCAALAAHADSSVITQLIAGCVGEGPAIELLTWVDKLDLPDPETLLADPKLYKPHARGDIAFAVLTSVVGAVVRNNTPDRWNAAWEVLERQIDVAADIAAACANPLVKNKPAGDNVSPPASVRKRLFPILNAATQDK